jgi:hypothetical protein
MKSGKIKPLSEKLDINNYTPPVDKVYRAYLFIAEAIEQEIREHREHNPYSLRTQTDISKELSAIQSEYK